MVVVLCCFARGGSLTDDQDRILGPNDDYTETGSLQSMNWVSKNLIDGGAFFSNFYVGE